MATPPGSLAQSTPKVLPPLHSVPHSTISRRTLSFEVPIELIFCHVIKITFQRATDIQNDSHSIIELAENSKVLAALLSTMYYPTPMSHEPPFLNVIIAARDMAGKYDMPTVSRRLFIEFGGLEALPNNALEVFCAAYSRELGDATLIAARAILKLRVPACMFCRRRRSHFGQ